MNQTLTPGCGYLSPQEIEAAIEGRLADSRWLEFESHIENGCSDCVTLSADLEVFRNVLKQGALEREKAEDDMRAGMLRARLAREVRQSSKSAPARVSFRWLQAVAAILILSVAGWLVFRDGATSGVLSIPLPSGELYAAQVKPFSRPPVLRGGKDLESLWYAAELAYTGGEYEQAENHLAEICRQETASFDARLYRAVSLLALGRVDEARQVLGEARELAVEFDLNTASLAWFEGLAALSAGDIEAAREALQEATAGSGEYAAPAREMLDRLSVTGSNE